MSKVNVIVLNTVKHTSTLNFEHPSSLVSFVGHFLDYHNRWNLSCDLILVHRNNQVVRLRFEALSNLVNFTRGIQAASWLFADADSLPNLNSLEWAEDEKISKVFDTKDENLERLTILRDLGHIPEDGVTYDDDENGFDEDPYGKGEMGLAS